MPKKKQTKKVARKVVRKKPALKESIDKACDIPHCDEAAPTHSDYSFGYERGRASSVGEQLKQTVIEIVNYETELKNLDIHRRTLSLGRDRAQLRREKLEKEIYAAVTEVRCPF